MKQIDIIKQEIINEIENQKEVQFYKLVDIEEFKNKVSHLEWLLFERAYLQEIYRAYILPENAIKTVLKRYLKDGDCECNSKFYAEIKEHVMNKKGWALNNVLNNEEKIKLELNANEKH